MNKEIYWMIEDAHSVRSEREGWNDDNDPRKDEDKGNNEQWKKEEKE
jgi:hypothetical protein